MLGEELMSWIAYFEIVHDAEQKAMDDAKRDAETRAAERGTGRRSAPGTRSSTMGSHNAPGRERENRRDSRVPLKGGR